MPRCRSDQSSLDLTEEKQWSHPYKIRGRAKECQVVDVMCYMGHTARDCKSRFDSGDSSARGCWSSQAVGTLGIFQGNANKAGQSFSVAAIYFQ